MTLVRWKPRGDMVNLQGEFNRLFEDLVRTRPAGAVGAWFPAMDMIETPEEFRLVAELPGIKSDQVKISISENVLTLRGEKKTDFEGEKDQWHVVERTFGNFERSFQLHAPVQADKVRARFDNGVLTVTLPKSEESRAREIQID